MLMWQLFRTAARFHRQNEKSFKNGEHDAVTSVFQNAFSFFSMKNEALCARARGQQIQPQSQLYPHALCVCVLVMRE